MSTGVIILARLDSRRLPSKALIPLGARPLLGHVLDRARRIPGAPQVVVATSDRSIDDSLVRFVESEHVPVFRGSVDDVAHRCWACAEAFGFDRFVRVCGDSPFFQHRLAGVLTQLHEALELDVATNVMPRTFPAGASVEVVSRRAMADMLTDPSLEQADREHVTRYFYRQSERFRIHNLASPPGRYDGVKLAVDTLADLDQARWILNRLPGAPWEAELDTIAELARVWRGCREAA